MACRQRNQLIAPTREKRIGGDDQRLEPLLGEVREGRIDLPFGARVHDTKLQAEGLRCRLHERRFAASTLLRKVTPVTLPPGRLRLGTSPALTGSVPIAKTTGMTVVAALAESADIVPSMVTITATLRRVRSFANAGNWS